MPKSAADNDPLVVVDGIANRLMIHIVIIHRYDDCLIALMSERFEPDMRTMVLSPRSIQLGTLRNRQLLCSQSVDHT